MFLISMSYLEIYNEEVKDLLTGESNMKIRESEVRFLDVTFWSEQLRHRAVMFIIFRHKKVVLPLSLLLFAMIFIESLIFYGMIILGGIYLCGELWTAAC